MTSIWGNRSSKLLHIGSAVAVSSWCSTTGRGLLETSSSTPIKVSIFLFIFDIIIKYKIDIKLFMILLIQVQFDIYKKIIL